MKNVAVYFLLVGVPAAGLAAILRAGNRLHAPPHLAGEWRVEGMALALDAGDTVSAFSVVQSGEHVEVVVGPRALRGRFAGDSLTAARGAVRMDAAGPCVAGAVRLDVRVDTAARPMRMWGTWRADEPGCAPVRFAATQAAREGR
ncbi:MAG TPA: hypothetical protein VFJ82_08925 [Longimicrobium sp.]|nr:hypothetical protein [Longimicrobium sp.]